MRLPGSRSILHLRGSIRGRPWCRWTSRATLWPNRRHRVAAISPDCQAAIGRPALPAWDCLRCCVAGSSPAACPPNSAVASWQNARQGARSTAAWIQLNRSMSRLPVRAFLRAATFWCLRRDIDKMRCQEPACGHRLLMAGHDAPSRRPYGRPVRPAGLRHRDRVRVDPSPTHC